VNHGYTRALRNLWTTPVEHWISADSLEGVVKFAQEAKRSFRIIACDPIGNPIEVVFNVARKLDFHN
jgi:hypothetical protein